MQPGKSRIRITWGGVITLALLATFAMVKGMEGVAATCSAGILTIVTGYQASRAYTKVQAIKDPNTQSPVE